LGTEHLLLAMAIAPPPDVARFFAAQGVQPWQVKHALRDAMQTPFERTWQGVIITERTKRVLELARASKSDGAPVAAIDLLHAIIADGGGLAARVLSALTPAAGGRPAL
jgi:ATP-dependent Clp protease ATP-binding subunit ClpA